MTNYTKALIEAIRDVVDDDLVGFNDKTEKILGKKIRERINKRRIKESNIFFEDGKSSNVIKLPDDYVEPDNIKHYKNPLNNDENDIIPVGKYTSKIPHLKTESLQGSVKSIKERVILSTKIAKAWINLQNAEKELRSMYTGGGERNSSYSEIKKQAVFNKITKFEDEIFQLGLERGRL